MKAQERRTKPKKKNSKWPTWSVLLSIILLNRLYIKLDEYGTSVSLHYFETHVEPASKKPIYKLSSIQPDNWLKIKEISPSLKRAILLSEDDRFYKHSGFDFMQIKIALQDYIFDGKRLRGASTISQQLAKNLYLSNDRNFFRKLLEMLIVFDIESKASKDKIFECYLNVIEYGEGIYGIKSAAQHYFQKDASMLSTREGVFIAMLLPNPKVNSKSWDLKELTPFASQFLRRTLTRLHQYGAISKGEYHASLQEKFHWERE